MQRDQLWHEVTLNYGCYKSDMAVHVVVEQILFLTSKLKKQMPITELHIISKLPSGGSNVKRMTVLYMLH